MSEIGSNKEKAAEWKPRLPESFGIEFMNTGVVRDRLSDMEFRFTGSRAEGEDRVVFEGARTNGDGTTIKILVTKGKDYKSPAEFQEESEGLEEK